MIGESLVTPTGRVRGGGIGVQVREIVVVEDMGRVVVLGRGKIPRLKGWLGREEEKKVEKQRVRETRGQQLGGRGWIGICFIW